METTEATLTQANLDGQADKRILVLGSAPHTRLVTAYSWDNLPKYLNVADYDVVILNLVPFLDQHFARTVNVDTLPSWQQFARLLFSQGSEIIAIGLPGFDIGSNPYQRVTWWLPPLVPKFVYDCSGEEIRDIESEFAYYFKHVRHWLFHALSEFENNSYYLSHYLRVVHPDANDLQVRMTALAQTRFQQPIAFELRLRAVHIDESYIVSASHVHTLKESGRAIWLPFPTEISDYEAVDLILREQYGLRFEQAPPDWVEIYKLPRQLPIEEEISQHQQDIQRLKQELAVAQQRLQEASRFRKLLYEQGIDGLEPVVRDALRELGAKIDDPPIKENREDGRLADPTGRKAMLEIKGRTKSLKLEDVRQLDQWVRDALLSEENWEGKGILIANTYCGQPPELRGEPFPPNCIEKAKIAHQCLLTTTQLFRALCSHQLGELDVVAFWDTVFNTNGVCTLPEMEPIDSEQFL